MAVTVAPVAPVSRVTLFKMAGEEKQKELLAAYEVLAKAQAKDGKPYLLGLSAGLAHDDPRSLGYTVACRVEFASLDDMRFYDDECPAHAALKRSAMALGLAEKPLTVYYTGAPQF